MSKSRFLISSIPSSFIRIRFSSEGQSILLIINIVLFILVVIFVSKRFDNYPNAKYKTVCWCIDFGKFWIVVWWQNQWRKPALSSIGKVFKVYESTPKFEISHQKQSHCYRSEERRVGKEWQSR